MLAVYELVPLIADIISCHCPGTPTRKQFLQACMSTDWDEAKSMIEGMLAEPWHLRGHQERRLRDFFDMIRAAETPQLSSSADRIAGLSVDPK